MLSNDVFKQKLIKKGWGPILIYAFGPFKIAECRFVYFLANFLCFRLGKTFILNFIENYQIGKKCLRIKSDNPVVPVIKIICSDKK